MHFARRLALVLLLSSATLSAAPADATRREARERFDRGLKLFNQRDDGGALAEFQRAYELIPHPLVLYNIGVVQAAMKHPVEAVDALDRLIASPGDLSADRLAHARELRAEQAARIARIEIRSNVDGARIEVDGVDVGQAPLPEPLAVASGQHVIALVASGHAPSRRTVTVAGGRRQALDFQLVPLDGKLGMLEVDTPVLDADVVVDGVVVGKTPLAGPLSLAPGRHVVDVRRKGYRPARQVLTVADGGKARIAPNLEPDASLLTSEGGRLALEISEPEAVVFVDGSPRGAYAGPLALPAGRHRVRVERAEFFPFERDVDVPVRGKSDVRIELAPTPEKRASYRDAATSQRTWGWVGLGAGAAVAIGSGAFLVWNYGKQRDAEDRSDELRARLSAGGDCDPQNPVQKPSVCAGVQEELRIVIEDKDAVNARYPWGFAALGVGAVGAGIGTYLLVTGDDPDRYEPRPESDVFGRVRVIPLLDVTATRTTLGVAGTF
ncbi:MAG: PEGA domain-containing protein [Polyangiaceae bacterium]|nr:PEGA domain-containing protein [Polyangiaceae bacterium]